MAMATSKPFALSPSFRMRRLLPPIGCGIKRVEVLAVQRIKSKTTGRQPAFFLLLILMQVAMVALLFLVIKSSWYNEYFNLRMRDVLANSYKASRKRDQQILEEALNRSLLTSRRERLSLELYEEMAISQVRENSDRSDAALAELERATTNNELRSFQQRVALQKLVRAQLTCAVNNLSDGKSDAAAANLRGARDGLQKLKGIPKLEMIKTWLQCSSQVAALRGQKERSEELKLTVTKLDDPLFASKWYQNNDIPDFDIDFNPNYRLQWYMFSGLERSGRSRIEPVTFAVNESRNSSVTQSTRTAVLHEAINVARAENDYKLQRLILNVWKDYCANSIPTSEQEALLAYYLAIPAMHANDSKLGLLILTRISQSLEAKLYSPVQEKELMGSLITFAAHLGVMYPHSKPEAQYLLAIWKRCAEFARRDNLSAGAPLLLQANCFLTLDQLEDARKACESALQDSHGLRSFDDAIPCTIFNRVSTELRFAGRIPAALRLLKQALAKGDWCDNGRAWLLIGICESLVGGPGTDQREWINYVRQIESLSQSKNLHVHASLVLDEYRLRSLLFRERQREADVLYRELKKKYEHCPNLWVEMVLRQLDLFRAWPSYHPSYFEAAKRGEYPEACVRDVEDQYLSTLKPHSDERGLAMLNIAQYYFCKRENAKALPYCKAILSGFTPTETSAYWAARDLCNEISGKQSEPWPPEAFVMTKKSKHQVHSLWSIYTTCREPIAAERLSKLLPKIRVEDSSS